MPYSDYSYSDFLILIKIVITNIIKSVFNQKEKLN